ncbi:hypothetical protein C8046_14150 [Serinibacter arcticus]|uniref:SWIM-type domain-containing protein n=1 Tax=Serinibacter arcticus TaxID=1655435 RepID=A0A2U1ZXA2_9MICO|nr:hypothetical protein C8046_14150 [Serinibacter arcticus]
MGLPAWAGTYRGYDDVALTAAASAGLVKRARGLLVSAPPAWVSAGERDGVVLAHKQEVRLDASGPAAARCACPAAGVCVHIVLACLFVHEGVAGGAGGMEVGAEVRAEVGAEVGAEVCEGPAAAEPVPEPVSGPSALDDLATLVPDHAIRRSGVVAGRAVANRLARISGASAGAETVVEAHRIVVTWDGTAVVIVAGAGWDGILVPSGVAHQRAAELRLEGVVRARRALGLGWEWPEGLLRPDGTGALTDDERAFLESVRSVLTGALVTGVARLDATVPLRVEATVTAARAHHLPELARALARVSEAMRQVVAGSDAVTDADVVGAVARAWAFTRALEAADGEGLAGLRGRAREVDDADDVRIQPVGAWTWQAASGARGATVAFLTSSGGEAVHQSVAGRARSQDPTFRVESAAIWGVAVTNLLDRTWTLQGARFGQGAEVSSSDRTQAVPGGAPDAAWLADAGVDRWAELPPRRAPRLLDEGGGLSLLRPTSVGRLRLDEVDQELVWPLVDADGAELEVRLGVLGGGWAAADNLTRLAESVGSAGLRLTHVLVRRGAGAPVPLSVVVVRSSGDVEVRSFTLGWPQPRVARGLLGGFGGLRKALEALRARVERRPEEVREATVPPVALLCERVREACVDVAVSGRQVLGEAEGERARLLARRCGDVGLTALAGALARWADAGTSAAEPEALLRVLLLAERASVVAAGEA